MTDEKFSINGVGRSTWLLLTNGIFCNEKALIRGKMLPECVLACGKGK